MTCALWTIADEISLKDGSLIKGKITTTVPNVSYTIQTSDGSVFVYTIDKIASVSFKDETVGLHTVADTKIAVYALALSPFSSDDNYDSGPFFGIGASWFHERTAFNLGYIKADDTTLIAATVDLIVPKIRSSTDWAFYGIGAGIFHERLNEETTYYDESTDTVGIVEVVAGLTHNNGCVVARFQLYPGSENVTSGLVVGAGLMW
jgi:hypothetical protein